MGFGLTLGPLRNLSLVSGNRFLRLNWSEIKVVSSDKRLFNLTLSVVLRNFQFNATNLIHVDKLRRATNYKFCKEAVICPNCVVFDYIFNF